MRRFAGSFQTGPHLSPDEYRLFRDLLSRRLGLWFGPESRNSLERRLRARLSARGLASFAEYYQFLTFGPHPIDEWDEVADALTTNETYFFREDYQLRAFSNEILPSLASRLIRRKRLRVWSAGCSTGEEAYTIAILILQSGLFEDWDVSVFGSDISRRCVAAARRGSYTSNSFRTTNDEQRKTWFVPQEDGATWSVRPDVRALCQFGLLNVLDEERTALVRQCDVVFCRNVLIYFEASTRKRAIATFYDRLVPGGVLLLGHAESLLNVSTAFELLHLSEDLVYRKPAGA